METQCCFWRQLGCFVCFTSRSTIKEHLRFLGWKTCTTTAQHWAQYTHTCTHVSSPPWSPQEESWARFTRIGNSEWTLILIYSHWAKKKITFGWSQQAYMNSTMYIYITLTYSVHNFSIQVYIRGWTAQTHGKSALWKHPWWVGIASRETWKTLLRLRTWQPQFGKDIARISHNKLSGGTTTWTNKWRLKNWKKLLENAISFYRLHILSWHDWHMGTKFRKMCVNVKAITIHHAQMVHS